MTKSVAGALLWMLALSACASPPAASPPPACPRLPPVPAWILEPEPSLIPVLDRIISPSDPE